jgi:hypothetical protein
MIGGGRRGFLIVAVWLTLSMKFEHGMLEFHGLGDTMAG